MQEKQRDVSFHICKFLLTLIYNYHLSLNIESKFLTNNMLPLVGTHKVC